MKLNGKLFKCNTLIPINPDVKKSRVYMVDVTTKQVYVHTEKIKNYVTLMVGIMMVIIIPITRTVYPQLYLDELSFGFKISLVVVGMLVAFLVCLWLKKKKPYAISLEEYLRKYPDAKKIKSTRSIVERAQFSAGARVFAVIFLLFANIYMYNHFFANNNLGTYILATMLFTLFLMVLSIFKYIIILLGIRQDKR